MAKLTITHADFTLEFENTKWREIRDRAVKNGIATESLRSRWDFGDGTEKVEFNDEGTQETLWSSDAPCEVTAPFFFDNAPTDIWLDFKNDCTAVLEPRISNSPCGARFHRRGNSYYGTLDYGNEIGHSDFVLSYRRDGVPKNITVRYDVLSSKLDYHKDWKTLVQAVEDEYRMLSYDFLKKTYSSFQENPDGDNSDLIWWEVFRRERREFVDACRMILDRPRTRYRRVVEFRRADQLTALPPSLENELAEHRGTPAHLYRTETSDASRDTPENRFFKYALETIADRHEKLATRVKREAKDHNANAAFLADIDAAREELSDLRSNPFFRGIGRWEGFRQPSLVLQQGLGYADVLRIYGILDAMYSLSEGLYKLETKDIATLYEIWCFIEVKNRVAAILGVKESHVKHKNRSELGEMFGTEMQKGKGSRILIEKDDTRLELYYNPETKEKAGSGIAGTEVPTGGTQRPDIVLQLVRRFGEAENFKLSYLFDAKYRIDGHANGVDTPPEDAINQMHRYRDAIYYKDNSEVEASLKKEVIGGYILFPGNGNSEDITNAYYTKSIDTVNIGAIPLRPGDEGNRAMLQEFIQRLISKKTEEHLLGMKSQTLKATVAAWPDDVGFPPKRILTSPKGARTTKEQAKWFYQNQIFVFPTEKLGADVTPSTIKLITVNWIPPVTMLVEKYEAIVSAEELSQYASQGESPFRNGRYHVWKGKYINCQDWQDKFEPPQPSQTPEI